VLLVNFVRSGGTVSSLPGELPDAQVVAVGGKGNNDLLICIPETMDFPPIRSLSTLSDRQKAALLGGMMSAIYKSPLTGIAGGFKDIADVLLSSSSEISRACRIPPQEAGKIIADICRERVQPLRPLGEFLAEEHDEMFTTGDAELDSVLGGGIRTGMLWEAVGER